VLVVGISATDDNFFRMSVCQYQTDISMQNALTNCFNLNTLFIHLFALWQALSVGSKTDIAQIPLRRLCDKVQDKFRTKLQTCYGHKSWKSATQITSPTFMICVRDFVANLSQTLSQTFCKHLDVSRWFVSATFMICVSDFHRNFMVLWFVTVCVHDFPSGKVGVMEFGLMLWPTPKLQDQEKI